MAAPTKSEQSYTTSDETPSNRTIDYIGILRCSLKVAENVTKKYYLHIIWNAFEAKFVNHLENITNCATGGDQEAVQACYIWETKDANNTYNEFLATVRTVYLPKP